MRTRSWNTRAAKWWAMPTLLLDATKITDAGLEPLRRFAGLCELHVEKTKVTREGLARLKDALPMCESFVDEAEKKELASLRGSLRGHPVGNADAGKTPTPVRFLVIFSPVSSPRLPGSIHVCSVAAPPARHQEGWRGREVRRKWPREATDGSA